MSQPLVEVIQRNYAKGSHKAMRPVDASSIMLVDRSGKHARVLMGKRNPAAKFMPGYFVFPGGRVETGDAGVPHVGALAQSDIDRLATHTTRPTHRRLTGLALAAIRETFEETGLRLGVADARAASALVPEDWREFIETGMLPSLEGMQFMARAITPPGRSRRFDTRFFTADVTGRADMNTIRPTPESELVELVWVTFEDALKLESAEITQIILGEVRKLADAGFPQDMRRPFYRMRHKRFERIAL